MTEVDKLARRMWEQLPVRMGSDVFCWADADQRPFLKLARAIIKKYGKPCPKNAETPRTRARRPAA
jgi:hypothetical protein